MAERKKPAAKKKAAAKKTRSTRKAVAKKKAPPKKKAAPKPSVKMEVRAPAKTEGLSPETTVTPAPKPPAPKEPEKPKARQLPSLKQALEWVGMSVDGVDGDKLGKLAGIHVDVEDGRPRWAIVKLGRLAGCTALPYDHVAEGGDRLFAAYERGWVKEAPRFKPDAALTADQELELCAHWGIRLDTARSAEVRGRKPDEISAVPAESAT